MHILSIMNIFVPCFSCFIVYPFCKNHFLSTPQGGEWLWSSAKLLLFLLLTFITIIITLFYYYFITIIINFYYIIITLLELVVYKLRRSC